jgi:hypothetical protein
MRVANRSVFVIISLLSAEWRSERTYHLLLIAPRWPINGVALRSVLTHARKWVAFDPDYRLPECGVRSEIITYERIISPKVGTCEKNCEKLAVADGPLCVEKMGWLIGYIWDHKVSLAIGLKTAIFVGVR